MVDINKLKEHLLLAVAIILLALLTVTSCNAQLYKNTSYNQHKQGNGKLKHSFTVGVDPMNTFNKGKVNSKGIDLLLKYSVTTDLSHGYLDYEFGTYYERFDKLNFESYGVFQNFIMNPKINNLKFAFGLEAGQLHRWNGQFITVDYSDKYYITGAGNIMIRYKINKHTQLELQHNLRYRTEWSVFVGSNFLNIKYTF